ncbi:NAD(P)-binding protein [Halovulum dunhuangense]|uniref:NAD(P)-binding protein n=1 Tax=Halovulum dunhuangense TaxID=1505036 RepID=A0A849L219_9RHOB|nr:FAD-dependent monooxygenase [Halovulum dunhuangense]NNU80271.1 NAD(P)-binding protein [Halovulum dunhuangense]
MEPQTGPEGPVSLSGRRIAVAGGGIGGMAAAVCLARRGADVVVHERAPGLGEVGAGLQIGPNGLKLLDRLGLGAQVRAAATLPERVEMRCGLTGRRIAGIPFGATAQARYGAPMAQMHRADLLGVLTDAALAAGVRISLGETLDPATPPEADAVIAADGVRSGFRARLVPDAAPRFTGQVAWRALVPAGAAEGPPPGVTWLCLGPGRHVVIYGLRGGRLWNVVAVEERNSWTGEGWNTSADPADLWRAFAGWDPRVTALLRAAREVLLWGLFAHPPLPRWQDGRVALLGDACHPMLPFLAQGATMAIEDAWVLADRLARIGDIPAALAAYEAARKPRTTRVQAASLRNARVYHLRPPALRLARDTGLSLAARLAPGGLLGRFDWLYGWEAPD